MRRLFLLLLLAGCAERSHLQVAAAASLQDALREIGAQYETARHEHVDFAFGASNILAKQIHAGAPIDLFISADEPTMNSVSADIIGESRRDLLSNTLVVLSRQPLHQISDLRTLKRIAIGDPNAVPAGVYAREYFQRIGMWSSINPLVVPTENVRGALAAVDGGNVDAAVVYRTDAFLARNAHGILTISGSEAPRIRYPAAVVRRAPSPAAARRFLEYLASPAAATVFQKYGFVVQASS